MRILSTAEGFFDDFFGELEGFFLDELLGSASESLKLKSIVPFRAFSFGDILTAPDKCLDFSFLLGVECLLLLLTLCFETCSVSDSLSVELSGLFFNS